MSEDILGFIDQMTDVAINHIIFLVNRFKRISLITHIASSLIIFISFFIFITIPIKKQLLAIDSLVNITFSINFLFVIHIHNSVNIWKTIYLKNFFFYHLLFFFLLK